MYPLLHLVDLIKKLETFNGVFSLHVYQVTMGNKICQGIEVHLLLFLCLYNVYQTFKAILQIYIQHPIYQQLDHIAFQ